MSTDYKEAVDTITAIAREGFSEINAIAGLLQCRIAGSIGEPLNDEELYDAIVAIRGKAQDIQSCILSEAEGVGVYVLSQLQRRRERQAKETTV